MHTRDSGRVQEKLINRLERQKRQESYEQERFLGFKMSEIHNKLCQALLVEKIIETDNPAAVSDAILTGLKKAQKSSEFDFSYFIAPLRSLVPKPNPHSLYMTQYILEVLINDLCVIEIYGTDDEIYQVVDNIISQCNIQFKRDEQEVIDQLSNNKKLIVGSRDYEIALDQMLRKKVGEPVKEM